MSAVEDLARALDALANPETEFDSGKRVVARATGPSPVQAILREVSETVLTRDLRFDLANHGTVTVNASGRRFVGIGAIDGLSLSEDLKSVLGQAIDLEDEEAFGKFIALLKEVDTLTSKITVQSEPAERLGGQSERGVLPEKLAEPLGLTFPFREPTRLENFRNMLGDKVIASLLSAGDDSDPELTGRKKEQNWLKSNASNLLEIAATEEVSPNVATLGQFSDQKPFVSVAVDRQETIIWVHGSDDIEEIHSTWRQIFT